eukprot:TRINITY_DN8077_c0_g1_i1.p1 TRINITY_DN8077_c0_g1~~TRINITY_DN8077_c0_g1_i1.p1  ORF type:complete len:204 (+),score=14.23 TRINITY_DN8077_c0_g1_i1:208-819(+)
MVLLQHVLLLQRNVPRAAKYYAEGVGLKLKVLTETWAELEAGSSTIALKQVAGESFRTTGYSPFLAFRVSELQETLQRIIPLGAEMDGPIRFTASGKVAAVRNPDGHMMSLFEPAEEQSLEAFTSTSASKWDGTLRDIATSMSASKYDGTLQNAGQWLLSVCSSTPVAAFASDAFMGSSVARGTLIFLQSTFAHDGLLSFVVV